MLPAHISIPSPDQGSYKRGSGSCLITTGMPSWPLCNPTLTRLLTLPRLRLVCRASLLKQTVRGSCRLAGKAGLRQPGDNYFPLAWPRPTMPLIQEKWIPAPLFPSQLRGHYLTPADAKELLTDERLIQASRHLRSGSCTITWPRR